MSKQRNSPWTTKHTKWFVRSRLKLKTYEGVPIKVWEFRHQDDDEILSELAYHYRNHYCMDDELFDNLDGIPAKESLDSEYFPASSGQDGPGTLSGDFCEILIADFIEWKYGFCVPRVRWGNVRTNRNRSTGGCDVVGFKVSRQEGAPQYQMCVVEVKGHLGNKRLKYDPLQCAIKTSAKRDRFRIASTLHFIKRQLYATKQRKMRKLVANVQRGRDKNCHETYGAAAVHSNTTFDKDTVRSAQPMTDSLPKSVAKIPNLKIEEQVILIVVKGEEMLKFVKALRQRACDEA